MEISDSTGNLSASLSRYLAFGVMSLRHVRPQQLLAALSIIRAYSEQVLFSAIRSARNVCVSIAQL